MNKLNIFFAALIVALFATSADTYGQDYHLSQFDALPVTLNPAFTGMNHDYEYRAASQYRAQWRALASKPFSTMALSFDMPIDKKWGVGGYIINNDGARVFNTFTAVVSGAYQITEPRQSDHKLTVGLQAGVVYENTNDLDLTFDNQYMAGSFVQSMPDGENFERFKTLMPEFNFGFQYQLMKEGMFQPYGGLSVFHITNPKKNFLPGDGNSRLPRRYAFNGGSKVNINDQVRLDVKGLAQMQGEAFEILAGLSGEYIFDEREGTAARLGGYYRVDDAFIILAGVDYNSLRFNVSYDINTSALNEYTSGRGALEFTLIYLPKASGRAF